MYREKGIKTIIFINIGYSSCSKTTNVASCKNSVKITQSCRYSDK